MDNKQKVSIHSRFPWYGWVGLLMIVVFWWVNWGWSGLRTHWAFTFLWVGYCLTVDALVFWRKHTSLLSRSWQAYLSLFGVSILAWWLFELFNSRLQNWEYLGVENFSQFEYGVLASISFSTVIPAVFGSAELVGTSRWLQNLEPWGQIPVTRKSSLLFFAVGWISLGLMLAWPRYFFPFLWLSVYFIIEPVNVWLGNRTLAAFVNNRDWRPLIALWLGALLCGFFWEMWNIYSYPKWIYHVPFVDFLHIFEMPLLGYGGYLPFAMELFAMYHMVIGIFGWKKMRDYVVLLPA